MPTIRTARDLAGAVRGRRLERGWSQADLADRARVSRAWLIDVEGGKRPNAELSRVLRLLDALGIEFRTAGSASGEVAASAPRDLDAHLERYRS